MFTFLQGSLCEMATLIKILLLLFLICFASVICMQSFIMRNGYCSIMATVLVVMNLERMRAMQDSCRNCPAGKSQIDMCVDLFC